MGTQFFWIFDAAVAVILIVFIFAGIKKGFISVMLNLAALIVAFAVALLTSDVFAVAIYDNIISDAVTDEVKSQIDSLVSGTVVSELKKVDMSRASVNGKSLYEILPAADEVGKVSVDLSKIDLSETGIESVDLSSMGISAERDYSSVNLGMAEYSASDIEKYGVEKLILSTFLADEISKGTALGTFTQIAEDITKALPPFAAGSGGETGGSGGSVLEKIAITIIDAADTGNLAHQIADNMIRPTLLVPIRALIFVIIFVIIAVAINLLSKLFKKVNDIPVIGGINKLFGAAAGFVQGAIVIFLVCIFVQVIISLTGNEIIFMNIMTIDKTYIFKHIYYFDFLDFMA